MDEHEVPTQATIATVFTITTRHRRACPKGMPVAGAVTWLSILFWLDDQFHVMQCHVRVIHYPQLSYSYAALSVLLYNTQSDD